MGPKGLMPLRQWTQVTMLPQRVAASLLAAMGLISLAPGARTSDVLRDVLLRGMKLTIAGLAAGIAGPFAVTRLASSMLVNVGAADRVTFGGVAVSGAGGARRGGR
jgi:hypothetical protein